MAARRRGNARRPGAGLTRLTVDCGARIAPLAIVSVAAFLACAPPDPSWSPRDDFDAALLEAPHRKDGRFFNPWDPMERGSGALLRWFFSRNEYGRFEDAPAPRSPNAGAGANLRKTAVSPEITWVGHATFAIHEGDQTVLTDPHFGPRASIVPREVAPGLPLEAIPDTAIAVISHNHYDHLDAYSVDRLPAEVLWLVPLGLADWFRARDRRVVELDWWERHEAGGWTFTCLPSQHWSRRLGQGVNASLWCAWLIESPAHRYFFAGDTGYFGGFAEYGRRYDGIDVAMLPIGAYAPRFVMGYTHLTPREALRAYADLRARFFLPMHWGTFDLTDEPLDLPPRDLEEALAASDAGGEAPVLLEIGETWSLPAHLWQAQEAPE